MTSTVPGTIRRTRRRQLGAAAAVALTASLLPTLSTERAVAVTGPTVRSVVTTADHAQLMATGASVTFDSNGTRPGQMITLNPAQHFQTMDGFGASLTDSAATLFYQLPQAQRDTVMSSLFSPTAGIGLSFLRQPIGGSDMIAGAPYTYDDLAAGQTDVPMAHFSIAHDEAKIVPLLKQALALNPTLKVMATPWSMPAWMKTTGSLVGGHLKNDAATVHAYALYLTKFVQAYQADGVPIYALTVQNEPQNRTPKGYAGTDMPVADEVAVINQLGPMLSAAGLSTKIMGYDHNWAEHPDDISGAAALGEPAEPNYPSDVLNSSAAQYVAGTAYHCYAGDVSAQTNLHSAFPNKDIWFTECSGFHGSADAFPKYFSDTLKWHAQNVVIGTTQNWAKSVVNWGLALDSQGNPHNGGCGDSTGWCTGVLAIDGTTVTRNAEYYTLGHVSKYVKTGAVRIGSNDTGDIHDVAFTNPDGSTAVFVDNIGGGTQTFGITWNGMVVSYTLPPYAIATLTWPAGSTSGDTVAPTAPTNLAASGTTATTTNLAWTASTDNVGVTGYNVYRGGTLFGTTTSSSYAVTGLSASTAYSFTVTAHDAAGNNSASSNTASVTTLAPPMDTTAPTAPANLTASGTTTTSTSLSWSASTDNVGVTAYNVYRGTTLLASPTGTSYAVTGLTASTAYTFSVKARDAAGNVSAASNTVSVTTLAPSGPISSTAWYEVINQNSGKCLDLADHSTSNGAALQQWACNSPAATNQEWQFRPTSNGNYQVVSRQTPTLAWDVSGGAGATGDGTQIQLWSYGGGTNQQWLPVSLGNGFYKFVALNSGKCLDVTNVSASDGARLQQWTCSGGPAQSFSLTQQP